MLAIVWEAAKVNKKSIKIKIVFPAERRSSHFLRPPVELSVDRTLQANISPRFVMNHLAVQRDEWWKSKHPQNNEQEETGMLKLHK